MTAKRYEPSPFFVLRDPDDAIEMWIRGVTISGRDCHIEWTSSLKESGRFTRKQAARTRNLLKDWSGVEVTRESFDDAQRRTCALAAKPSGTGGTT